MLPRMTVEILASHYKKGKKEKDTTVIILHASRERKEHKSYP